jgi:DNA polymerase III subunit delta
MYLIVGKDEEEVRRVLAGMLRDEKAPLIRFDPENFTIDAFRQEVETPPFLSKNKGVVIQGVDELAEEGCEAVRHYLEKPSAWIALYLTAAVLPPQSKIAKLIEKGGKILRFAEEKPWEKEKRLAAWLMQEAEREGVRLALAPALRLIQSTDSRMLRSELDKLICFVANSKQITVEDIALISTPAHHETLWQLGDALFACDVTQALSTAKGLLDEGMTIFPLLANLRTQCTTGVGILKAAQQGEVAQKYPYLKGALLEKKLKILKKYSAECLEQAILLIFETEIKAKNSGPDPMLLLEVLIVKLTHLNDTLFIT